jgi:hypothetical protein
VRLDPAPSRALTAVACKALAKEVGRVAAFGGDTKSLDADDLTRCNASAKGGVQTAKKYTYRFTSTRTLWGVPPPRPAVSSSIRLMGRRAFRRPFSFPG